MHFIVKNYRQIRLYSALAAALFLTGLTAPSAFAANLPEMPRVYIDTTYAAPTGSTIVVNAGDNFQTALNNTRLGDTIVLQAGATFTGPFTLPNKTGAGWIYIRSSDYANLPPAGTRVSIADAAHMPKIEVGGGQWAIMTANNANHFRFVGIEIRPVSGQYTYTLVNIGNNDTSLSTMPTDITFDRCYIHGDPVQATRRGVAMNGIRVAVIDSYVADFKEVGADTQALWAFNTPGPLKVVNNFLEAAGENLMLGGAAPLLQGVVPSDVEIRGNLFFKRLDWVGSQWIVKNLIEFKLGARVLVQANLFQNNWMQNQQGFAALVTPRNENNTAPWSVTKDLTYISNRFSNAGSGFAISGSDDNYSSQRTERVLIRDNFIDANGNHNTPGIIFQISGGPVDLTIDQNTAFGRQDLMWAQNPVKALRFVFQNNIVSHGQYGIVGTGANYGTAILNANFDQWVFTNNAIIGQQVAGVSPSDLPPGNFFPADTAAVKFVDFAGSNFALASNSPYKGVSSNNGRDLGADFSLLPSPGSVVTSALLVPRPPSAVSVN